MKKPEPHWSWIGAVGRPHGVRGAFFLSGRTAVLHFDGEAPYTARVGGKSPESATPVTILQHTTPKGRDLLQLSSWLDRTQVETHYGASLWVPEALLSDPDAPWSGCEVEDVHGKRLGTLRGFVDHGATPNAQIQADTGHWLEVPFVDSFFIQDPIRAKETRVIRLSVGYEIVEDLWDNPDRLV